jgi:2-phosphosulfolactate phosphatase
MPAPDLPPPIVHRRPDRPISVHLSPKSVDPAALEGGVAVMIDALRASVTIAAALHAGAERVWPVRSVEEALALKARLGPHTLMGGERGGTLIPGFDLANSPLEYTPQRVAGRALIFTTTNGTAALLLTQRAQRTLIASFANLARVAAAIAHEPRPVHILCAGTRDQITLDDVLPAGALVERSLAHGRACEGDDSALLALHAWQQAGSSPAALTHAMHASRGGRNLARLGLERDVDFCARLDTLPVLPVFDPASGQITAAEA